MATVNFSQYLGKLNEYLGKNGMENAFQDAERTPGIYERIFAEFFSKTPYLKMNQAFIEEGMKIDNLSKMVLKILHRSEAGRNSLILAARCQGQTAKVVNALICMHDSSEINPMSVEMQLLRDLLDIAPPNLKHFYFPRWKNLGGKVFGLLEQYGYTPEEIIIHMELPEFFSALPEINDRLGVLPEKAIQQLTFPMGFVHLEADDQARAHAYLSKVKGKQAAIESWLKARSYDVSIRFLGLNTLCEHLGIDDPLEFIEYVARSDHAAVLPLATDFVALIVEQAGLEGLHPLSAKCINYLVKNTALTPEQAVHLPVGGRRFAQSALERDLGI